VEQPEPTPGPGQVVVRMRAASLNYRDLLTVEGKGGSYRLPLIPFSDGAGEIASLGAGVTRVAVGERVCPMFFQSWFDGRPSASSRRLALGGTCPGVLQELMVLDAEGVSRMPSNLTFEEAATLPCAALTAWRALFEEAHLRPGDTVLVQGTGGVSIFALQLAKLAGAAVIVTSSSDHKLERAKTLGADHTINYRSVADWGKGCGAMGRRRCGPHRRSRRQGHLAAIHRRGAGGRDDPDDWRAVGLRAADRDSKPVREEFARDRSLCREPENVRTDGLGN
jgi:NADPH:quinone reductase-like Zn-dependent oxidoreductase